jgi:hypothetical protein
MAVELSAPQNRDEDNCFARYTQRHRVGRSSPNEKTLGKIILKPDSTDLINGVQVEPLQVYPEDRGFFKEFARLAKGIPSGMLPDANHM